MARIRSLLLAGCSVALFGTCAGATDFYVMPAKPGPVAGVPIAAVTLQATASGEDSEAAAAPAGDQTAFKRLRTTVNQRGNSAGKWLRPGADAGAETAAAAGEAPAASGDAGDASVTATAAGADTGASSGTAAGAAKMISAATDTTTTATTAAAATTLAAATQVAAPAGAYANLDALIKSGKIKGGDRILLMAGSYGTLNIQGLNPATPVTIEPVPGQLAHAEFLVIRSSKNLVVRGIKVWALSQNFPVMHVVRTYPDTANITLDQIDARAFSDSGNYMKWPASTWLGNKRSGFLLDGTSITLQNSRATGVYHGILAQGPNAVVKANIVDGFGGDGMRALGDNSLVQGNRVQNCFAFDANHDDGFQSFSRGPSGKPGTGVVKGLKIIGNKIIEWDSTATNPLRCKLQGIGMFDGMYDDVLIENNLIASSANHGITVAGGRRLQIINNTVVNINGVVGKTPWIRASYHKNGTPGSNVTIANNLAMAVIPIPTNFAASVEANNVKSVPSRDFAALAARNFQLSPTSPAGDAGTAKYAPTFDILNAARPKGKAPDAGAYESR